MMKQFIRKHLLLIIFTGTGAIGGFLYWKFVGCMSGTCFIKSKWYMSTLYGLVLGYLAGSLVTDLVAKLRKGQK